MSQRYYPAGHAPKMILIFDTQYDYINLKEKDGWQNIAQSDATDFVLQQIKPDYENYNMIADTFIIPIINNIVKFRKNDQIWIGTPQINYKNVDISKKSLIPFYSYIQYIKGKIEQDVWKNNVAGIYMNAESIYGDVDYNNLTKHEEINLMYNLSKKIHAELKKKFLWIPYYTSIVANPAEVIKKLGLVANTTNIFDYVIIQPGYFNNPELESNMTGIVQSINRQVVCYRDGIPVSSKTSKTIIGAEMELDASKVNDIEYSKRYGEYTNDFGPFLNKYPIAFYWQGDFNNAIIEVNKFY